MSTRGLRALSLAGAAAILIVAAACSGSTPTPIYVTPPPSATAEETTPLPTDEATEPATDTPQATFTPWPTESPTPEPTPVAPTPTPAPTPTGSPTPTSPAGFCLGSKDNQNFFLQAAHSEKFTVYCASSLPAGWALSSGSYAGATVTLTYKYKKTTSVVLVQEGAFCTGKSSAVDCESGPHPAAGSGSTSFDGMTGGFFALSNGFMVSVSPNTTHAYLLTATNVTSATTVATIAAGFKAVPKI